jgi:hypothetical protein
LLMSFCGGLAGFSSGFIRRAVGFHALSLGALALAATLLLYALRQRPGSPAPWRAVLHRR